MKHLSLSMLKQELDSCEHMLSVINNGIRVGMALDNHPMLERYTKLHEKLVNEIAEIELLGTQSMEKEQC